MTDQSVLRRLTKGARCPECGATAEYAFRPFCSKRCADVDLGRWLKGDYRIPVDEEPEEDFRE